MVKIYFYSSLILIAIFSSCSLHEIEEELAPTPVELEDYSLNGINSTSQQVGIVNFTFDNYDGKINEGVPLEIINSSMNAVSYHWDFGNFDSSTEATPDYQYDIHGIYNVTLTIEDKFGNKEELSKEITVLCVFTGEIHSDI